MNFLAKRPNIQLPAFLRTEPVVAGQPLNDDPGREIRIGVIIAALFFIGFLGWAAIARMDAAAYATGQVTVSGHRQAVQHREGGVVQALLVKDGQHVRQGQVLVQLAGEDVLANERALSAQVIGLKAQRARLQAEQLGLPAIQWPAEFTNAAPDDREEVQRAMAVQQNQFATRGSVVQTAKSVLRQRNAQLAQQAEGYRRQLESSAEQERLIADELAGIKSLQQRGYAPLTKVRALERAQAELRGQRGQYAATIAQSQEQVGETRLQILEVERTHKEKVASELRDVEFALTEALPKLQAAQDQLARVQLRAPATGTVVGLSVFTVGGVIQPGQKLMDIVPDRAPMLIEARVSPNDADDLRPGQETTVRFTGLHDRDLPNLKGELVQLSADAFTDEKTGASYFTAQVAVPLEQLEEIQKVRGDDFQLRPGMPVEVLVPLRKRTALQYFFEPLTEAVWRSFREH